MDEHSNHPDFLLIHITTTAFAVFIDKSFGFSQPDYHTTGG